MGKKSKIAVFLLLSTLLVFGNIFAQENAKEAVGKGLRYLRNYKYDEAITEFNKAIKLDPNNVEAYYSRGFAYYYNFNYDQAMSDANKAIELNPNVAEAYAIRGHAYNAKHNYDQAISDYNKAIDIDPNCDEAYSGRSCAYDNKGNHIRSMSDAKKAEGLLIKKQLKSLSWPRIIMIMLTMILFIGIPFIAAPIIATVLAKKGLMIGLAVLNILLSLLIFFWFFIALGLGGLSCPPLLLLAAFLVCLFAVISGISLLKKNGKVRVNIVKWSIFLGALTLLSSLFYIRKETLASFRMDYLTLIFTVGFILFPLVVNYIILTRSNIKDQFK
jgi:tetratricopeptide (TPR) repeat protein